MSKRTPVSLFLCLLAFAASGQTLSDWQIQSADKVAAAGEELSSTDYTPEGWHAATVPTTVLHALVADGTLPDPYYGLNLKEIPGYRESPWLVMPEGSPFKQSWWFRTEFDVPAEWQGQYLFLQFEGINYEANIWLNGKQIAGPGDTQGMFQRFEFPVRDALNYGASNALAVEVIPPGMQPDIDYDTKQIEGTTGWDDHNPFPPDMNMGLWQDVVLAVEGPVSLRHPYVRTDLPLPDLSPARLTVSTIARNNTDQEIAFTLGGNLGLADEAPEVPTFSQQVTLAAGETREITFTPEAHAPLLIDGPRIWWPIPIGRPELYSLHLSAVVDPNAPEASDASTTVFGIREVDTYIDDEDWRVYTVNGRHILIRGGAWMTSDMMLNLTPERYEALVRYAAEAGLNMLRSEGFSIRETDEFYSLCDRYGVMVTQQIYGRSIPDEARAIAHIEDMMLRVRNHPSLVHFLGHDETQPTETLDQAYRDLLAKYTPERTYQPHSGTFNVAFRKETGGTRTGTLELWTYAGPSHYYLRKFDGAWGFAQSGGIGGIIAPLDSLRAMLPEDQLWPPLETEGWSFHSVTQGADYFNAVLKTLEAKYEAAEDIEQFVTKVEAMNYNSARGMYEAFGRNKYNASGITTWKYDAAWPAAMTWQYIDHYLRPTAAYYGAKKACETLHVQYAYDDESVYVVSGIYAPVKGLRVIAALHNFDGNEVWREEKQLDIGPDSVSKAFEVAKPETLSDLHFLALTLTDAEGATRSRNVYWLSTTPDIPGTSGYKPDGKFYVKPKSQADFTALNELPEVVVERELTLVSEGDDQVYTARLTNTGGHVAFQLRLDLVAEEDGASLAPAYWQDNHFTLLPGETREVQVAVPKGVLSETQPILRVQGWNTNVPTKN
jgi:exo-1,4-beta-D-glucosaminidase